MEQIKSEQDQPSISVIMPVYNATAFLPQAVDSVLSQSHRRIELLLVDDGSTDGSRRLCKEYAEQDSRVRVLSQNNAGPAAARNLAVRHAEGELIYFLDADDYLLPDALAPLVEAYVPDEPDMVLGNFAKLETDGTIQDQPVCFSPNAEPFRGDGVDLDEAARVAFLRHFLKHPSNHLMSYCWARLYRADVIQRHGVSAPARMHLFEDYVFNLNYLQVARNVRFVNQCKHIYRMHTSHPSASMALLNAERLVADMEIFREETLSFFQRLSVGSRIDGGHFDSDAEIGHALTHYAIIFLVRTCRLLQRNNWRMVHQQIRRLVRSGVFRHGVQGYKPQAGNSRLVPLLAKLGWVALLMLHCRRKAVKRYGPAIVTDGVAEPEVAESRV